MLSSIALLKELNLNPKKILKYYKTYQPSEGRGRIYEINRYNKKFKLSALFRWEGHEEGGFGRQDIKKALNEKYYEFIK